MAVAGLLAAFTGVSALTTILVLIRAVRFVGSAHMADAAESVAYAGCYLAGVWAAIIHLLLALAVALTFFAVIPSRTR